MCTELRISLQTAISIVIFPFSKIPNLFFSLSFLVLLLPSFVAQSLVNIFGGLQGLNMLICNSFSGCLYYINSQRE